jgi:hypothetical protein
MLFGETVAVYCENHTEHTNTLCGQNAVHVKAGGSYSNRWVLKGLIPSLKCNISLSIKPVKIFTDMVERVTSSE